MLGLICINMELKEPGILLKYGELNIFYLDYLLMECQKINSDSFNLDLKELTEFGVSVRYPDDFYIPSLEESTEYFEIALSISRVVEELIALRE